MHQLHLVISNFVSILKCCTLLLARPRLRLGGSLCCMGLRLQRAPQIMSGELDCPSRRESVMLQCVRAKRRRLRYASIAVEQQLAR